MKTKIIIATKSKLVVRLISVMCQKNSLPFVIVQQNDDIFELIKTHEPDIIFLCHDIIEQSDNKIVLSIKQINTTNPIQVIVTSSEKDYVKKALSLGADAFLPVPFSKMKFESVLRTYLGHIKRILLIGKIDTSFKQLKDSLLSLEYIVDTVSTGEEAMHVTHQVFPDLILCDYNLEDINALELKYKLKEASLAIHIPFIILTSQNDDAVIDECFKAGVSDVMLMPFHSPENISKITSLVPPPKKGKQLTVLVIDDSAMVRKMICGMFKELNYKIFSAENGAEGLRITYEVHPDLITCDYDMPVMNGWDFCVEANKSESINDIPVIMVTARGTSVDKKKGEVLGVSDYLTKPFKIEDLKKSISKVLASVKEKKEKEEMSKYVASDVIQSVSDVIDGIKNREPEEKFITVMFSDICSFTPKCERLGPRKTVALLNSYFEVMINVLQSYNAIIDKIIGDAIVARFDSGNSKDDACNAVTSAYYMLEKLKEFNKDSIEEVHIRIGINSGTVIMGDIGSKSYRLDYTAIGDNMNIGQRLESQADKMGCMISEATYEFVSNITTVGDPRDLSLKGKTKKVIAYPLLNINTEGSC